MRTRMQRLRPALLAIGLAAGGLGGARNGTADDCLSKPNAPSPPGQHWFYHLDRATHRECWYLGVAGAKLHQRAQQAALPERANASRPIAQPVPPSAVAAAAEPANNEIAPAEAAGEGDDATAALSPRWSSPPAAAAPLAREAGAMRNSYAQEQPATETQQTEEEMPLVWPILTPAELAAAGQPDTSTASFAQLAAVLAAMLGLAALIARVVFSFSAARKPLQDKPQRSATARHDVARQPARQARPSRIGAPDMEASVRGLLHDLQRLQHDDRRRNLHRPSPQVA